MKKTKKKQSKITTINPMIRLKKNLKALKNTNQPLHKWVMEQKDVDWIDEIRSKNGDKNMLIREGANIQPAYSMNNPTNEAVKAAKRLKLHKENISIIAGFGLGYLAKAILDNMEKGHRIIVIEPVGHMIKLAFGNFDFAEAITKGRLLIIAPGKQEVMFALHFMSNQFVIADWFLTVNKYTNAKPDIYKGLVSIASDAINQIMCNVGTIAGHAGGIIADNDISCLPYVIRHRGVVELKDLYKDKPAVLVSTGPSLAKNIHHLIGMEGRVVIIAVGQALRVLLAYGIQPSFCATVDFGEVNMGHFVGLMDCGVPLVTINRTYAPLLKAWQGPKFVTATPVPNFEHMATGILTSKGFISAGGSVAHLCFGLASEILQCSPIIFIGQDLAIGDKSHIPLADASGETTVDETGSIQWMVKDHRCSLHGKQTYSMGPQHFVDGYFGGKVLTNLGLASFLTSMEAMITTYLSETT